MQLRSVWKTVRWSLQKRGVGGTLRAIPAALGRSQNAEAVPVHPFDARYGTETGGLLGGGALAAGHRNDVHITAYAGIAPSRLVAALEHWEATLDGERLEDFAFVDLGCGKGRAMLLASERPFRLVLGVELNPGLAALAERNVARWRTLGRDRAPLEVRQGDATELVYPDGPCLVYLYNSFGVPVVRQVLEQMHRRVAATGSRVDLIYQNVQPESPMKFDAGMRQLWSRELALTEEEQAADPVASREDVTELYRF